jgi:hypothetical protein
MILLSFIIIAALAAYFLINEESSNFEFSRYTKQLNHDSLMALFRAMQQIEQEQDEDIQFLLNAGKITKKTIEDKADNIMFELGEFPAESLDIDVRDFDKLIKIYESTIRGASLDAIEWLTYRLIK